MKQTDKYPWKKSFMNVLKGHLCQEEETS
jgi:hypothetical protein